jgi:trigger factor
VKVTIEKNESLNGIIKVQVSPEDYRETIQKSFKDYARKANLPGFRPGKVPVGVVKRMMGPSVFADELIRMATEKLFEYIREEKLDLLGNPLPKDKLDPDSLNLDLTDEYEFDFEIGFAPEFELNLQPDGAPVQYKIEVDDSYIEKEIAYNQDRFGKVENPETVEEGDIVFGQLQEVDADGKVVEGGFSHMTVMNPSRIENPAFFQTFFGQKLEESRPVDIFSITDDLEKLSQLLFIEKPDLEGLKGKNLALELRRINRVTPAGIGQELFDKVFGEGEVDSEEAFRSRFAEVLKDNLETNARNFYRNQLRDKLLEAHSFDLPEEFLKKFMLSRHDHDHEHHHHSQEEIDKEYNGQEKGIRWELIVGKLMDAYPEAKVTDEDVRASIREAVINDFGKDMDEAQLEEFLNQAMKHDEVRDSHFNKTLNEKVFNTLATHISPEEKTVLASEFEEIIKAG